RLGAYLRAGTENPQLVQAFGITVPLMVTLTYAGGAGLAARSEQFGAYQGPWPGTRSNALGHVERFAYEAARGQPTSKVDANGLAESYLYDAFGRETLRRFADGSLLATDYLVCG
ncbi:hypothetical protein, partial [Enterobacter hormaechei]|uniref:RHS repeat domain-containing protein n=1 Tax=Enterobacter hormaechei TaxID=158836 RepID=UPI001F11DBA0